LTISKQIVTGQAVKETNSETSLEIVFCFFYFCFDFDVIGFDLFGNNSFYENQINCNM